jgi:hypothetical protein
MTSGDECDRSHRAQLHNDDSHVNKRNMVTQLHFGLSSSFHINIYIELTLLDSKYGCQQ